MLTIVAICLAVLTCTILLVGIYFVSVLSSCKKTIDEIGELVVYIKAELPGLKGSICKGLDAINMCSSIINEVSGGFKTIKERVITPFAFILGIYAGVKSGLNIFLKGGDKDGNKG
ncbi:MAG: hypothetical protein AB1595_06075 [bacterium]